LAGVLHRGAAYFILSCLRRKSSNSGTVKALSPCAGL
jgi:hypothetical protein